MHVHNSNEGDKNLSLVLKFFIRMAFKFHLFYLIAYGHSKQYIMHMVVGRRLFIDNTNRFFCWSSYCPLNGKILTWAAFSEVNRNGVACCVATSDWCCFELDKQTLVTTLCTLRCLIDIRANIIQYFLEYFG